MERSNPKEDCDWIIFGGIVSGGDRGKLISTESATESLLLKAVQGDSDDLERMPLEAAPLSASDIAILRSWLEGGASGPDEPLPGGPKDHWSFKRPIAASVPAATVARFDAEGINDVDRFVLSKQGRFRDPTKRSGKSRDAYSSALSRFGRLSPDDGTSE